MSIISVSDMTLQAMVNTYGTALIVAYGVCIKVEGVGWQMAEAIGTSLGTFTGQNVGANHLDRVKQGVRCAYLMNAVCYGSIYRQSGIDPLRCGIYEGLQLLLFCGRYPGGLS